MKKTKPRNTLKQLVCFIGFWEGENVIEGEIGVVPEFVRNTGLSWGRQSDLLTVLLGRGSRNVGTQLGPVLPLSVLCS